ncbi:MAG: DUF4249 family protein [Candidatus Longimicrobiales bacterium M2_2A_002]
MGARQGGRLRWHRPGRRVLVGALVAASVAGTGTACDLTSSVEIEPEDVIVVEGYLRAHAGVQEVFLYRTLPRGSGSLEVDGATVVVTGPIGSDREIRVEFSPTDNASVCAVSDQLSGDGIGTCYMGLLSPEPGRTYTLQVTTAGGLDLSGTTTLPGDFALRQPDTGGGLREPAADSCVIQADERLELIWTQSEGARSYIIEAAFTGLADGLAARGIADPPDELDLTGLAVGQADTTLVFPNELGVFDRFTLDRDVALALQQGLPTGAAADILIAAGDQNYVNWVRGGTFNPSGQVRVPSITGDGTGVFGSLVAGRVTILTETTGYPACR